ncbi:hypothetical protein ABEB36_012491 [Hypothenemus hampei]|uniref:Uncharacterized protein n=1 Tax=Hypothenemus hampei TaxID=57062 RepID=A0ABD1EFR2_HYPHA
MKMYTLFIFATLIYASAGLIPSNPVRSEVHIFPKFPAVPVVPAAPVVPYIPVAASIPVVPTTTTTVRTSTVLTPVVPVVKAASDAAVHSVPISAKSDQSHSIVDSAPVVPVGKALQF